MCRIAWMKQGDSYADASTRGELRALLGVEPVFVEIPDPADDDCLCCCDIEKTAALVGYTARSDDFGDVELTPHIRPHTTERKL